MVAAQTCPALAQSRAGSQTPSAEHVCRWLPTHREKPEVHPGGGATSRYAASYRHAPAVATATARSPKPRSSIVLLDSVRAADRALCVGGPGAVGELAIAKLSVVEARDGGDRK